MVQHKRKTGGVKLRRQSRDGIYFIDARAIGAGRIHLGTRDKGIAQNLYKEWLEEFGHTRSEVKSKIMLQDAIDLHVKYQRRQHSGSHADRVEGILTALAKSLGSSKRILEITRQDIEDYIDQRRFSIAESTVNKELRTIKAFFKFLLDRELLIRNPTARLKQTRVPDPDMVILDPDEIYDLLKASEQEYRDIWIGFLFTGLRKSELMDLQVKDIKRSTNQLSVVGKGSKRRYVPILPSLRTVLDRLIIGKQPNDTVFPHHPNPLRILKRCVKKASIKKGRVNIHAFRHTFVSLLLMEGSSLEAISRILGHASIVTTFRVYGHLLPKFTIDQMMPLEKVIRIPANEGP